MTHRLVQNIPFSLPHPLRNLKLIYALVAVGVFVRIVLLVSAENMLGVDESTVGNMALDIFEGKDHYFFFTVQGNIPGMYNGAAALEAYLGAIIFIFFGPSYIALKSGPLVLWTISAFFFADLSMRSLSGSKAFLAMLFYSVGTPFFLEWSLKNRGGYMETVLFSIFLLWLANPPGFLKQRLELRCLLFGIFSGIGLWASEMILPMIFIAGLWFVVLLNKEERTRAVKMLFLGFVIGMLPLIYYNITHDYRNFKASVVYNFFMSEEESKRLWPSHMILSAKFVLGKGYMLLLLACAIAFIKLITNPKKWELGHVVLVHACIYTLAYWLSGLRFTPVPPSRTLFALYPGMAVLFAYGFDWSAQSGNLKKSFIAGCIVLWLSLVSYSTVNWVSSGLPREFNSWRGSWSFADYDSLYDKLMELDVDKAYMNTWSRRSLIFSARKAAYRDTAARPLEVEFIIPKKPAETGKKTAMILNAKGRRTKELEELFHVKNIPHQKTMFRKFIILTADSSYIHQENGFVTHLTTEDWESMNPVIQDGFN